MDMYDIGSLLSVDCGAVDTSLRGLQYHIKRSSKKFFMGVEWELKSW